MDWTKGKWISTPHCVSLPAKALKDHGRRLSVAFFVGLDYDATMDEIEPENPEDEAPVLTFSGWRKKRIKQAMDKLKANN